MKKTFLAALCALSIPFALDAQTITNTPNSTFVTSGTGRDIALSIASPNWTLDLSTSSGADLDLYAIVGNGSGGAGTADLGYYTGLENGAIGLNPGPQLVVGRDANGNTGTFVWKFVLAAGQTTTGGTITADVGFNGTPSTQKANVFIGTNGIFTPTAGPSFSNYNSSDFSKVNLTSNSATFGTFTEDGLSLAVPTGVSEFYVVLSDTGSSARFGLDSLSVSVTAIPEPSTTVLLMAGIAGVGLLRRHRGRR